MRACGVPHLDGPVRGGDGEPAPAGVERHRAGPLVASGRTVRVPRPEAGHTCTGPSVEVAASIRPSGAKATERTRPGTANVAVVRWSSVRRRATVPSELAVASETPSGAKATAFTGPIWPSSRAENGWDWVLSSAPRASAVASRRYASSASTIDASGRPPAVCGLDGERPRAGEALLVEGGPALLVGEGPGGHRERQ